MYKNVICDQVQFYFYFPIRAPFVSLSCPMAVARTYSSLVGGGGERGCLCLVLDLTGKTFSFSPLHFHRFPLSFQRSSLLFLVSQKVFKRSPSKFLKNKMINDDNFKNLLYLSFTSSQCDPLCSSSVLSSTLLVTSYSRSLFDWGLILAFHSKCHHHPSCFQHLCLLVTTKYYTSCYYKQYIFTIRFFYILENNVWGRETNSSSPTRDNTITFI